MFFKESSNTHTHTAPHTLERMNLHKSGWRVYAEKGCKAEWLDASDYGI